MSTKAYITPQLLRWARERYGLSTAEAAERLHVSLDLLQEWEGGEALPTLRQAQDVASRLNVPLGYLFLSTPPSEDLPIPDLRRVADEPRTAASPELIDLVSDVLLKQEWYRDYQEREEAEPLPFIGKYSLADKPTTVATDIRQSIGLDAALRQEAQSLDGFLRKLIGRVESAGVLVLRSGIVQNNTHRALNVAEFRGFAISDRVAPLVFINGRDAKSAQIFTLGHELAHLWIGSSGISNPGYLRLPSQHENTTELFCNQVAADLLVPAEDFLSRWSSVESLDSNIQRLAAYYRVSGLVILRRAYELHKITYDSYHETYKKLAARQQTTRDESSGGDFYASLFTRNSRMLATALVAAVADGTLSHRDAARLLHVKVGTLGGIARRAFEVEMPSGA